jgi:hypothetical protein
VSTDMLTLSLLLLMAASIAVLVVLVIYLVDRFNGLERDTKEVLRNLQQSQQAKPVGPYGGLSGRALWDALTGAAAVTIDELTLDGIRKRYRLLLGEHIEFIFREGVSDQPRGFDAVPANTRMVRTPRSQVESWLPGEAVEAIYRCGQGYALGDPAQMPDLRQRLDQVCSQLHIQTGLEVLQPASSALMPYRPAESAAAAMPEVPPAPPSTETSGAAP